MNRKLISWREMPARSAVVVICFGFLGLFTSDSGKFARNPLRAYELITASALSPVQMDWYQQNASFETMTCHFVEVSFPRFTLQTMYQRNNYVCLENFDGSCIELTGGERFYINAVRFPDGQPCSLLTKACLTAADPRIFCLQTWKNLFNWCWSTVQNTDER